MIFRHLLNMRSHPTWVRGLKQSGNIARAIIYLSHPTWVRGLKRLNLSNRLTILCRTLRGCVD